MIFIKPKKRRKKGIYIKSLATPSEIQICRIRITEKIKLKLNHTGIFIMVELFVEELK